MFFLLSKILLFLISPAFWIILLLLWSFYTKKETRKKRLRIITAVLFILFTNPFLFNVLVRAWQPAPVDIPKGNTYSAAILLGGLTMTDRYDRSFFTSEADRLIQTTKLYHSGVVKNIAIAGGIAAIIKRDSLTPEADHLKQQLLLQGIPEPNIILENKSRNTFENAQYIKHALDSLHLPPPYILITSALHVPRAVAVFKKAGIPVIGYPAAYKQVDHRYGWDDFIVPSIKLLPDWSVFLKEVVGLTIYKITGKA